MTVSPEIRRFVTERAGGRCEYCGYPENVSHRVLDIEHVFPLSLGGTDDPDYLALACSHCNGHKAARVEGVDPLTGETVRLFNPRTDSWHDHFRLNRHTARIEPLTAIGRATEQVLHLNDAHVVAMRHLLIGAQLY